MSDILENCKVLFHSAVRINRNGITVYFDPYGLKNGFHDADAVFITHDHFDHFSPEDISRVAKEDTLVVMPETCSADLPYDILRVAPGRTYEAKGILFETVPAYNVGKKFHPKENAWVGYIVTLDGFRYYVAGDTDINDDVRRVRCDAAFLPVGGTYTMTAEEAASLANEIRPKAAVPTHFGSVAGDAGDGDRFGSLLDKEIIYGRG